MTGTILTIQHYAVHDGPGIRTLVFMKGCPLRCSWCCNPESQLALPQLRYLKSHCKACLKCVEYCPTHSVAATDDGMKRSFDVCNVCQSKVCIEECNNNAITVSGKEISSAELVKAIALDISFYRNSGGGVTFSGGEPLMQPAFLLEVLKECKALEIHTAIETCGWTDRKSLRNVIPFTDLFLFDLKIIDPESHLIHTGMPIGPILENLAFLASENANIVIRLPLVPGITDTIPNLESIAKIMHNNGLKQICLEPYHSLGQSKYEEHGLTYNLDHLGQYNLKQINAFCEFFTLRGLYCEVA
ncbi:MAG: glycyl-radical enzyme activating protein [Bacteroidales bacterium]